MHTETRSLHRTPSHVTHAAAACGLALLAPQAFAHHAMDGATPTTFMEGLLSGFAHPVIGIDHFAFLLVTALLSAMLIGGVRYLLPLAFVGATVGGTAIHLGAADLPMTETVIAMSVLLGGVAVLFKRSLPALLLGGLLAVVGVYHGYAYGESIVGAEQTPLLAYLAGFAVIQYVVIAAVIFAVEQLAARSTRVQQIAVRSTGAFAAATGALFLGMSLA